MVFVLSQTLLEVVCSHEESFGERALSVLFISTFLLLRSDFAGRTERSLRVTFLEGRQYACPIGT